MSATIGFVKGVAFTVALFVSLALGFDMGKEYTEKRFKEDAEDDSVQDVEVDEN